MKYRYKLKLWDIEIENDNNSIILQVRLVWKVFLKNNFKKTVCENCCSLTQKYV